MTEREQEYLEDLKPENFLRYCQKYLKIQSKDKGLIRLIPNPPQIRLFETIKTLRDQGSLVWIIILKARQQGFSTITEALNYQETSSRHDHRACIVAHEVRATRNLFKMFGVFYDFFPEELRPHKPSKGSRQGIEFDLLRSSIQVLTAGNALGSSGQTFQSVHISELAKWPFAEEAYTSLMPAVTENSLVVVESTAFGLGNFFHRMWVDAKLGKNGFTPIFFPWFENPKYRIKLKAKEVIEPDRDERYYVEKFALDNEQLKWMRWARQNKVSNGWTGFRQEYPADETEAFVSSGRTVFDIGALCDRELKLLKAPPPIIRGDFLLQETPGEARPYKVQFIENAYGDVQFFGDPQEIRRSNIAFRCGIGCDVAEGLLPENSSTGDPDWNAFSVWDRYEARQIATGRNRMDGDEYGRMIFCIQSWLAGDLEPHFWGMATVERTGPGIVSIYELKRLYEKFHIPLHRMYHRGPMDRDYEPTTDLLGFRTHGQTESDTKPIMIGEITRRIREGVDGINSLGTVGECKTYVQDGKLKRAQSGCHDDEVIAYGLSLMGAQKDFPPYKVEKPVVLTGWRAELAKQTTPVKSNWTDPDFRTNRELWDNTYEGHFGRRRHRTRHNRI